MVNSKQLAVVLGCVIDKGKVLLIQRKEPRQQDLHGFWEFPGGKIRFGEDPKEAIAREILEETGALVLPQDLFPFTYSAVRKKPNMQLHVVILCYRCYYRGEVSLSKLPHKVANYKWAPLEDVNPLHIQSGTLQFLLHELRGQHQAGLFDQYKSFPEYLVLKNIDPQQNINKIYRMLVEARMSEEKLFRVQRSWGRFRLKKFKFDKFARRDALIRFMNKKIEIKKDKGYKLEEKSKGFPDLYALHNIPLANKIQPQLSLF